MFFRPRPKTEVNNALLERATPAPQRNLADIFADLEASDRRQAERRQGGDRRAEDRRSGEDRRGGEGRRADEARSEDRGSENQAPVAQVPEIDVAPKHVEAAAAVAPVIATDSIEVADIAELEPADVSADMRLVALMASELKAGEPASAEPTITNAQPSIIEGGAVKDGTHTEDLALPEFDDAQRRLLAHRQAIEAMLEQARRIEDVLAAEAADALMAARRLSLKEKNEAAAQAAEAEQQAAARANDLADHSVRAAEEHDRAMTALGVACSEMANASEHVTECEARLRDALQSLEEAKTKVREGEELASRVAVDSEKAKAEAQEAREFAAECRQARESREAEAREAAQLANSFAPSSEAADALRNLESRIQGVGLSAQFS